MATGSKKGSAELIIFSEIEGGFGDDFDWEYANSRCVPHPNGDPKHSLYLSIYRALEHIPLENFGRLYLTTRDGRTLGLDPEDSVDIDNDRPYWVYQELCPIFPVVVSKLSPGKFASYITDQKNKTYVPKIVFADLKTINFDDPTNTGNIGGLYDKKIPHLMSCVAAVTADDGKANKTLDRSQIESFSFQVIRAGIFAADASGIRMYRMPDVDAIKQLDYDWGRSAMIL